MGSSSPQADTAEVAAAVAALFASGTTAGAGFAEGTGAATGIPALAALLVPILPAFLLRTPEVAASVAGAAARVTLTDLPEPVTEAGIGDVERRARLENLLLRGFFAVAASRRLSEALRGPSGTTPVSERLAKAFRAEESYFTAHKNARARNLDGARRIDQARDLYGSDVLGWYHGATRMPADPRPNHVAAHGFNFDPLDPPIETEGLPSTLPYCSCVAGPPWPGGRRGEAGRMMLGRR